MKDNIEYLKDLREVKKLMERSNKFISLSGMSGVMAGIYALICAFLVYKYLYVESYPGGQSLKILVDNPENRVAMFLFGGITLFLALSTGIILTIRKASNNGQKVFSKPALMMLYHLLIPLIVGGLACAIMMYRGGILYIAPFTLIFYGLALINASNYTFNDIKGLGIIECLLGLTSMLFLGHGLLFWALGFGVGHIIYGLIMYKKYDRK